MVIVVIGIELGLSSLFRVWPIHPAILIRAGVQRDSPLLRSRPHSEIYARRLSPAIRLGVNRNPGRECASDYILQTQDLELRGQISLYPIHDPRQLRIDRGILDLPPLDEPSQVTKKRVKSHCGDRKSTRLNSSHVKISYAVF